jgi:hypothetical protein
MGDSSPSIEGSGTATFWRMFADGDREVKYTESGGSGIGCWRQLIDRELLLSCRYFG